MLDQITPVILARDEEVNIGRTLGQLTWANEIVLVDSMSTDATLEIARRFQNVRIFQGEFGSLTEQTTFGLNQVRTPWVLLLDSDFFVPHEFADEARALKPGPNVRAYIGAFEYAVNGRKLRASLYPPRIVLFQRAHTTVWQDGHAPRYVADGEVGTLTTRIVHDDRKNFARFIARQKKYMRQEAEKIRRSDVRALPISGRIRKLIVVAPFAVVVHTLFVKGLILDGRAGLRYTWERFVAEVILSRELLRRRS
ncbi:MAG TPA: glycosyltransferase family 2 protein [Thermoanaerobaculia bacterium]